MNNVTLSTQKNVVVNIVILCIFLFALKNQILRYVVECKAVILLTTLIHTNVTDLNYTIQKVKFLSKKIKFDNTFRHMYLNFSAKVSIYFRAKILDFDPKLLLWW